MAHFWTGNAMNWLSMSPSERTLLIGLDLDPVAVALAQPNPVNLVLRR